MDYAKELNAPIDFFPGDFSGVSRCTNITILDDMIVEYDEAFNVILKANSSRLEILSARNMTQIKVMEDNDCKLSTSQETNIFQLISSCVWGSSYPNTCIPLALIREWDGPPKPYLQLCQKSRVISLTVYSLISYSCEYWISKP